MDRFLLTHPVWDVTLATANITYAGSISTHTSRVGCDEYLNDFLMDDSISTHTSRVGCDYIRTAEQEERKNFYSHIPCGM